MWAKHCKWSESIATVIAVAYTYIAHAYQSDLFWTWFTSSFQVDA